MVVKLHQQLQRKIFSFIKLYLWVKEIKTFGDFKREKMNYLGLMIVSQLIAVICLVIVAKWLVTCYKKKTNPVQRTEDL